MPNRWPIADGNWSNSAIWSGSIIPTASDDVFANNRAVYIDVDITVQSIRTTSTGSASQHGGFFVSQSRTITLLGAGLVGGGNSVGLNSTPITYTSSILTNTLNIIGDITGSPNNANYGLKINTPCVVNITGSIRANPSLIGGSGYGGMLVSTNPSDYTYVNISGSIFGIAPTVSPSTSYGFIFNTPLVLNVSGNVETIVASNTTQTIGNAIYNVTNTPHFINILGNIKAVGSPAIYITAGNTFLNIKGTISASISSPGVHSTVTTATNLFTGPFYNTGSYNAVYAYRMQLFDQPTRWTFDTEVAGVTKTLTTIESITGAPSTSDVRDGVTYGLNGNLTGSLKMPNPTTVRLGVATDNTTGSAILTAEDMFNVATQTLTTSGSIGNLLTGASTVQTTGATISAFKV